ncbi:ABC transporter substrate-binding protein [Allokutzneria sp. NRRL B-24872]|uniref:ABC transporter substrate-binding protein n=1 Tax=Allokutzneria sp. NRRL B-24872 TaxID=1137961 RepID=UPI000A37408F|nr:ABC transporter substrate-binding protein [Allokutzneria sp. NRRL B-24872]
MRAVTALFAAVLVVAAGCAPVEEQGPAAGGPATAGAGDCAKAALKTRTPGKFTFGTDQPVYEPWFSGDDPSNGKGFESAVAYAVAGKLGYAKAEVDWVRVPFNAAIQPGPKSFDANLNEFSITEDRRKAVDFSTPYYDVTQAVVAFKSSPAAKATTVAALKEFKLGAQVGTTSYDAAAKQVQPTQQVAVYNNNDDAKQALRNNQVQAIVVDLATAFYITSAELTDAAIVGQLPASGGKAEQFGIVLDKGSSLTRCVSAAVDALRADGTLTQAEKQWLAEAGKAPKLT